MRKILLDLVPGLIGGAIGGLAGYFVFVWLLRYSLFAPIMPGALAGLACGAASRSDSKTRGILCSLEALLAGLLTYWLQMSPPFDTDGSFLDLVSQAYKLPLPTLLMLGGGVVLGYWWGRESSLSGLIERKRRFHD